MSADAIEVQLGSSDPEVRRRAVQRLSGRPLLHDDYEAILSALNDSDWRVRREAIALASQVTHRETLVRALLEQILDGGSVEFRNAAIQVLGRLGRGMPEAFTAACERADARTRRFVIEAMGQTCDPALLDVLQSIVHSADTTEAAAAVEALVSIAGLRAERILQSCLDSPDLFLRVAVVEGLTRLGAKVPWSRLRLALDHSLVRRISAELLGRTAHPEALEWLLALAGDPATQTSSAAFRALAELGSSSQELRLAVCERLAAGPRFVRRALYDVLMNGDSSTREAAAFLAVLTRDETCLEAVVNAIADDLVCTNTIELLRDWGTELVEPLLLLRGAEARVWAIALGLAAELAHAHEAELVPMTLERLRHALDLALQSASEPVRTAAVAALAAWGSAADCARLADFLRSQSESLRNAARSSLIELNERMPEAVDAALQGVELQGPGAPDIAAVLARLSSATAAETLKRGLQSCEARTRRAVVESLTMSQGSKVAELVGYAVADEDLDVQIAAVRSLGRMNFAESEIPLRTALVSPFPTTRAEAALALGRLGASGAGPEIAQLLDDTEAVAVAAAVEALGMLNHADLECVADEALSHADEEVFKAGLRASGKLPAEKAEARLRQGLRHAAWHVRLVAVELLERLDSESSKRLIESALAEEIDPMLRQAMATSLDRGR